MKDSLGHWIEEGDVLIQGSGEWGIYSYQVTHDPEVTKKLRVVDLNDGRKCALSKNPKFYLNATKLFDRYDFLELEAKLTEYEGDDNA